MHNLFDWRRASHAAAGLVMAISMGPMGAGAVSAAPITPDSVNGGAHFADCLSALFGNGAAHKEFCAGGNTNLPVPGTLAPTSNGPASSPAACVSELAPRFGTFMTASVDETLGTDFARHFQGTSRLLAACPPPDPCAASLDRAVFSTFDTASIDGSMGAADYGRHLDGRRVAVNCCQNAGSLSAPRFSTFATASLGDVTSLPDLAIQHEGAGVLAAYLCPP